MQNNINAHFKQANGADRLPAFFVYMDKYRKYRPNFSWNARHFMHISPLRFA